MELATLFEMKAIGMTQNGDGIMTLVIRDGKLGIFAERLFIGELETVLIFGFVHEMGVVDGVIEAESRGAPGDLDDVPGGGEVI